MGTEGQFFHANGFAGGERVGKVGKLGRRITADFYDKKVQDFKDKVDDILEQQKLHSKADKSFYIMASRILELANKAAELFESSEREQKRQLLQFLLQNCQLRGKNIDFTMKKPFDAILLANKSKDWLCILKIVRTHSAACGGEESPPRNSEIAAPPRR